MKFRQLNEEYEGFFSDNKEEDEKRAIEVYNCFNELNDLLGGYIVQVNSDVEFWLSDEHADVFLTLDNPLYIEHANFSLDSEYLKGIGEFGFYAAFFEKLYNIINKNRNKINKVLKYIRENHIEIEMIHDIFSEYKHLFK